MKVTLESKRFNNKSEAVILIEELEKQGKENCVIEDSQSITVCWAEIKNPEELFIVSGWAYDGNNEPEFFCHLVEAKDASKAESIFENEVESDEEYNDAGVYMSMSLSDAFDQIIS
ncbi:hypothetical protein A3715_15545 [Oleiphilus sp. HI0009]|nr:hypothetical protein A3715_15545 [Oleiphilus sp. HI0009]